MQTYTRTHTPGYPHTHHSHTQTNTTHIQMETNACAHSHVSLSSVSRSLFLIISLPYVPLILHNFCRHTHTNTCKHTLYLVSPSSLHLPVPFSHYIYPLSPTITHSPHSTECFDRTWRKGLPVTPALWRITSGLAHRALGQVKPSHRNTSGGTRSVLRDESRDRACQGRL